MTADRQAPAEPGDTDLRGRLVGVMKRGYSLHGDGLLANMADAVMAAGWVPPERLEAARALERERIAAVIEAEMGPGRYGSWRVADTAMAAFRIAAGIARGEP